MTTQDLTMSGGGDGGAADMSGGGGGDMAMATLTGMQVYAGQSLQMVSITKDDWAVFLTKSNGLSAVSLAGGMPKAITATNTTYSDVVINNNVVFAGSNIDMNTFVGDLYVWSSSSSSVQLNKAASRDGYAIASDDGQYILYNDNATMTNCDLFVAKVDGSNAKKVLSNVSTDNMGCFSGLYFAGGKFIVAHCDGTSTVGTITTIDPASGMTTDIRKNVFTNIQHNKGGTKLAVIDQPPAIPDGGNADAQQPNKAYVMNIDGTMAAPFDQDVAETTFPDDNDVLYIAAVNMMGALKKTPVANPNGTTLTTMNANGFQYTYGPTGSNAALSPDGSWVITLTGGQAGQLSDLYLASTTNPGMPTALSKAATGCLFQDAFTRDSKYALFYAPCVSSMNAIVGTFMAQSTAAGSKPVMLGQKVWNDFATANGDKVVFNDNWKARMGTNGRADLKVVDVSAATPMPVTIATQAEADYALNKNGDKIVFAYAVDMAKAGIYVAPVP